MSAIDPKTALVALRACIAEHPKLVRLGDVAKRLRADPLDVATALGHLQADGRVGYNLTTGFTVHGSVAAEAMESMLAADELLAEYGGIAGQTAGARAFIPVSYQSMSDVVGKQLEKSQRAQAARERTRNRLRELAQEGLAGRIVGRSLPTTLGG